MRMNSKMLVLGAAFLTAQLVFPLEAAHSAPPAEAAPSEPAETSSEALERVIRAVLAPENSDKPLSPAEIAALDRGLYRLAVGAMEVEGRLELMESDRSNEVSINHRAMRFRALFDEALGWNETAPLVPLLLALRSTIQLQGDRQIFSVLSPRSLLLSETMGAYFLTRYRYILGESPATWMHLSADPVYKRLFANQVFVHQIDIGRELSEAMWMIGDREKNGIRDSLFSGTSIAALDSTELGAAPGRNMNELAVEYRAICERSLERFRNQSEKLDSSFEGRGLTRLSHLFAWKAVQSVQERAEENRRQLAWESERFASLVRQQRAELARRYR